MPNSRLAMQFYQYLIWLLKPRLALQQEAFILSRTFVLFNNNIYMFSFSESEFVLAGVLSFSYSYHWEDSSVDTALAMIASPDLFQKHISDSGKFSPEQQKELNEKYTRHVWWARRQGSVQSALTPFSGGQVQYQYEGARLVALLALDDLCYLGDETQDEERTKIKLISVFNP